MPRTADADAYTSSCSTPAHMVSMAQGLHGILVLPGGSVMIAKRHSLGFCLFSMAMFVGMVQRISASTTGDQWQQFSSSAAACNGRSSKQTAPCCLTRSSTPWAARSSGSRTTMPASATGSATPSPCSTCCSATSSLPAGAPTTHASGQSPGLTANPCPAWEFLLVGSCAICVGPTTHASEVSQ